MATLPKPKAVPVARAWQIARGEGEPATDEELSALADWLSRVEEWRTKDPKGYAAACKQMDEANEATQLVFPDGVDKATRRRLHKIPGFATVTAPQLISAGRAGYRGEAAVRHALQQRLTLVSSPGPPQTAALVAARPREARPRERRSTRSRSTRARADDGPSPPRACGCGCGEFTPARRDQRYRTPGCRVRALRARRGRERVDLLDRYRDEIAEARRSGALDELEALDLLLDPPPRVLDLLAGASA